MKMGRLLVILTASIIIVSLFALPLVYAQSGQGQQGQPKMMCNERFKQLDANGDGKITKEEFMSGPHKGAGTEALEMSFKAVDANGDGEISLDEFCAGKGMQHGSGKGMQQGSGKSQ